MRKIKITLLALATITVLASCKKPTPTPHLVSEAEMTSMKIELGKNIFNDKNLSNPGGQSCSSCHSSATAFSDISHNAISEGALNGLFGNRNAPSIVYSNFNPPALQYDPVDGAYFGGQFLDGRANTLADQAQKPFLNPLEMNNIDAGMVISKIQNASYFSLYQKVYGDIEDVNEAFANVADAIAAFENSDAFAKRFTSKFDYYLKGQVSLTAQELSGLQLFTDTVRAKCGNCHLATPDDASGKVLFTDFTYTNDGVPKNPDNPFYTISSAFNPLGANFVDLGLGGFLNNSSFNGMFKVSSLRNIALTAPYFHNGSFNTLEEVVHFYNVRDVPGSGFAPPEVLANLDTIETGNLHLTPQEEKDIVAFLKTLTDGFK